jgi:hypothetical protein
MADELLFQIARVGHGGAECNGVIVQKRAQAGVMESLVVDDEDAMHVSSPLNFLQRLDVWSGELECFYSNPECDISQQSSLHGLKVQM